MKKVGILSMQRICNYGSFLQAYGLKKLIEELGCHAEFVDYHPGSCLVNNGEKKGFLRKLEKASEAFGYNAPFREKIRFFSFESTDDINRQVAKLLEPVREIVRQNRILGQEIIRLVAITAVFDVHDVGNEVRNCLDKWLGAIIIEPIFVDEYRAAFDEIIQLDGVCTRMCLSQTKPQRSEKSGEHGRARFFDLLVAELTTASQPI